MLNARQQKFVAAYLISGEAKAAAVEAGYSERTAKQIGSRLLAHPEVSAAIAEGLSRVADKAERKAEEYLRRVDAIAFATPGEVWSEQSVLKAAELGMRARRMLTDRQEIEGRGVLGVKLEDLVPKRWEDLVPRRKLPPAPTEGTLAAPAAPAAALPAPSEPEPPPSSTEELVRSPARTDVAATAFDPLKALLS